MSHPGATVRGREGGRKVSGGKGMLSVLRGMRRHSVIVKVPVCAIKIGVIKDITHTTFPVNSIPWNGAIWKSWQGKPEMPQMCGWTWEMVYGKKNGFSATLQTLATFRWRQSCSWLFSVVNPSSRMKWTPLEGSTPASVDGGDHQLIKHSIKNGVPGQLQWYKQGTPNPFSFPLSYVPGRPGVCVPTDTSCSFVRWSLRGTRVSNQAQNNLDTAPTPGTCSSKKHLSEHIASYF